MQSRLEKKKTAERSEAGLLGIASPLEDQRS
jgi:hypothetical protein